MSNVETASVPESEYVTIISSEGHELIIKRKLAMSSETIAAMISGPSGDNEVHLRYIPFKILRVVCCYFHFKVQNAVKENNRPEFPIEGESALDVLLAANLLDC